MSLESDRMAGQRLARTWRQGRHRAARRHASTDRNRGRHMQSEYLPPAARGCGLEAVLHQLALQLQRLQRAPGDALAAQPVRRQVFAEAPAAD
ncbi:hypothetical protein GGR77_004381 [Xanthomonas translucens]